MTNEELLADLKQFIEATVSQQMSQFATKDDMAGIEQRLSERIDQLDDKIDLLDHKLDLVQDAIGDSLVNATDVTNESISGVENVLEDHGKRLTRLERRRA